MNKRQLKKYKQKCVGELLSYLYGTIERKYLGILYKDYPSYFKYFGCYEDKTRKRIESYKKIMRQIKSDSVNPKYQLTLNDSTTYNAILCNLNNSCHIIETYHKYKKKDSMSGTMYITNINLMNRI